MSRRMKGRFALDYPALDDTEGEIKPLPAPRPKTRPFAELLPLHLTTPLEIKLRRTDARCLVCSAPLDLSGELVNLVGRRDDRERLLRDPTSIYAACTSFPVTR